MASADAVVFASTSAVENFCKVMLNNDERHSEPHRGEESRPEAKCGPGSFGPLQVPQDDDLGGLPHKSFCIGRMTQSAASKHGFETITSDETTVDSLVKKIVDTFV